jgi:acetoacetyl-CoA synthetase
VYAGKRIDCLARVADVASQIPAIEKIVVVAYGDSNPDISALRDAVLWSDFVDPSATDVKFERLPFDHPLYILYSSGTTGLPKCMVHSAGGTLLQHYKELMLHTDLKRSDRVFYFTTCGWMMWNWLMSGLAAGCTLVLYDGAPLSPRQSILWDMAAAEGITTFGVSAKYLALAEKEALHPSETHDLSALTAVLSTGSPLAPQSFDYVYS